MARALCRACRAGKRRKGAILVAERSPASSAFAMVRAVTTGRKPARRRRGGRSRRAAEAPLDLPLEEPAAPPPAEAALVEPVATSNPEPLFAARVLPPEPERPRPSVRRGIFFDVENSSRADHVARVLAHLDIDRMMRTTDLVAVGNWRVVNHDTARLLAERGAHLVHSAPSVGVRDWSCVRIAVDAGVWLAQARPGDLLEIVTDDQAFDAVGDVATSLGVGFHRLSFRALAGAGVEPPPEEARAREPHGRRRRRGGRRGRREEAAPAPSRPIAPAANGGEPAGEAHTAPHDELLAVARELLAGVPERTVSIDALSNALKARGFRRTPGSPRLITRLRRIKELEVSRTGAIRLVEPGPAEEAAEREAGEPEAAPGAEDAAAAPTPGKRRRRRRGGRRARKSRSISMPRVRSGRSSAGSPIRSGTPRTSCRCSIATRARWRARPPRSRSAAGPTRSRARASRASMRTSARASRSVSSPRVSPTFACSKRRPCSQSGRVGRTPGMPAGRPTRSPSATETVS